MRKKRHKQDTPNTKEQVFKVQRPIGQFGPNDLPLILIYNEDRSVSFQSRGLREFGPLFKGRFKIFVMASIVNGQFKIGEEVADPGW